MFHAGLLSYTGGLALVVLLLVVFTLLKRMGASFGEALYLSASGLTLASYGVTEWRLRRRKTG